MGKRILQKRIVKFALLSILFSWGIFQGQAFAQTANTDYAQAISGNTIGLPVIIDVLANDDFGICTESSIVLAINVEPTYGEVIITDDKKILFIPDEDFKGSDSFHYAITCSGGATSYAWVHINIAEKPDNIIEPTCFDFPEETTWGIEEVTMNETLIHNLMPIVAGDIDGDGVVEIIVANNGSDIDYYDDDVEYQRVYPTKGLSIFYFNQETQSLALKRSFSFPYDPYQLEVSTAVPPAIARYNDQGYIIVRNLGNLCLYAFSPTGTLLWKSDDNLSGSSLFSPISITDFNGDGIPEVYTGNKIFSLATGELLCTATGHLANSTTALAWQWM